MPRLRDYQGQAIFGDLTAAANRIATGHKDGMNVLYGDGHVDWLGRVEAQRVTAQLQAGNNPP